MDRPSPICTYNRLKYIKSQLTFQLKYENTSAENATAWLEALSHEACWIAIRYVSHIVMTHNYKANSQRLFVACYCLLYQKNVLIQVFQHREVLYLR